ncbi:MAG: [acyl-carrier-protein] S-malonyltransferase [Gemmatimonadetes bacterium]|nr:[acyl-carrier-protein] S-malonyltransferase [Gemmatimonadota bacterium]|tara:strand:+ start:3134 stop:4057 length:924 start_codon:yes stop_codon:yes gene_type:complete
MATAFLFPGQASQYVGMGKDLCDAEPEAKTVFSLADRILDVPLKTFCFNGPEESLRQTSVTQPAVFTHSVAALRLLEQQGRRPDFVAGHSVGELAALVASGALDLEDGLHLVDARAQAMSAAGKTRPGTMAAIIGLDDDDVVELCEEASADGIVAPANYNSPAQVAISGDERTVRKAMELATERGAKRVVELAVSCAFHSPLMGPAVDALRAALETITFAKPTVPVVPNVTAEPTEDPDRLKQLLVEQVVAPVRWTDSIAALAAQGVDNALEVGPGAVLKGLVRRIDRSIKVATCGTLDEIHGLVEA